MAQDPAAIAHASCHVSLAGLRRRALRTWWQVAVATLRVRGWIGDGGWLAFHAPAKPASHETLEAEGWSQTPRRSE
jgi:hypothetical protein